MSTEKEQLITSQRTKCYNAIALMRDMFVQQLLGDEEPSQAQQEQIDQFNALASEAIGAMRDVADERDSLVGLVTTAAIAAETQKVIAKNAA